MFPLAFPLRLLARDGGGGWVLDPFCGRGTTNFAARLLGMPSVGVDSSPVAAAIAAVKLVSVRPEDVIDACTAILRDHGEPREIPQGPFWEGLYHPRTFRDLCRLRDRLLEHCCTPAEVALRALVLGVLHGPRTRGEPSYLSNQMPRTYATKPEGAVRFWAKRGLHPPYVSVQHLVTRRAWFSLRALPPPVPGRVVLGDSRSCALAPEGQRFRWVVTSPPYYGMRTYRPDQWLRNWFVGGPPEVDYTAEGQVGLGDAGQFAHSLAQVWARVAGVCVERARLVVRFGALPSMPADARQVLKDSFRLADAGWRVTTIRDAGLAPTGRRQADQFGQPAGCALRELDLYAVLEA